MTIREASENIGKLVIHKELGMLFWIDSIADRVIRPQQVKAKSMAGMNSYFYPEDLVLVPADVQKWHDVYQSTPAELTTIPSTPSVDSKFKPGDVVQLKSGGPLMTVFSHETNSLHVDCMWWTSEKFPGSAQSFYPVTLELVNAYPAEPDVFTPGQIVRLRSGGPMLTITETEKGDVVECALFKDETKVQMIKLRRWLVRPVKSLATGRRSPLLGDATHAKLLEIAERQAQWDTSEIPRIYAELLGQIHQVSLQFNIRRITHQGMEESALV